MNNIAILIKDNMDNSFLSLFKDKNGFKTITIFLDNLEYNINMKENQPDISIVVIIDKDIYFSNSDNIISIIHNLGFKAEPSFLVVSNKFSDDEIDIIIENYNNILILPVNSRKFLFCLIKKSFKDNILIRKLNKYIVDSAKTLIDSELHKRLQEKEQLLLKKVTQQKKTINEMFQFSNKLNLFEKLDDILNFIIKTIKQFINCDRISIMLVDDSGQYLSIKKSIGIPTDIVEKTRLKIDEDIAGKVFGRGEVLVINNMEKEGFKKKYSDSNSFISYPILCSPLVGHKIKIGVINITNKKNNQPFTENDKNILSYISYSATIAINNRLNEIKLENTFLGAIKAIARTIEAKDSYTIGHSERVAKLSSSIAREMQLSNEKIRIIEIAGILHDVGKIYVPGEILRKPIKLTKEEYDLIKEHPARGEKILADISRFKEIRDIIRHHHERIDGTGYPDKLKGEDISLETKIIAVADTFDAMNSDRTYRTRIPYTGIINELKSVGGSQLDNNCIKALLKYLKRIKFNEVFKSHHH